MRSYHFFVVLILGICLLSITTKASATLLSLDDVTYGAGAFTKDTDTGLQWLDLSLTLNESMNSIKSKSVIGGSYFGLRYATQDEVWTLFSDAGISPIGGTSYTKASYDTARGLLDLMVSENMDVIHGITGTGPVNQNDVYIAAYLYVNADTSRDCFYSSSNISAFNSSIQFTSNSQESYLGSFLVRDAPDAPVPEPATFLLLSSALALAGFRAKKFLN